MTTRSLPYFFLIIVFMLPGISHSAGKDIRSLKRIEPRYFELSREFTPQDSRKKVWTGKTFPGFFFCKGRYVAEYKDRSGTYFMPPVDCDYNVAYGIWVPDNPGKDAYETWVIIQKSDIYLPPMINWLDNLEVGNYKKTGFEIIGPDLIEEISRIFPLPEESSGEIQGAMHQGESGQ